MLGTIQQITDQSTLRWESIVANWTAFESSLDPVVVINDQGIILFFNKSAETIWGYTKGQVMNTNVKLLMPQPFRGDHDTFLSNYNRSNVSRIMNTGRDVPIQHSDGTVTRKHLKLTKQDISGMTFFIGTFQEPLNPKTITLLEQEREIVSNLIVPSIIINEQGLIQAWNSAAEQSFGFSATEVMGQNVKMLMTGSDKENHDNYLQRYLETGENHIIGRGRKVVAFHKDGTIVSCSLWVSEKSEEGKKIFTGVLQPFV